jgi:initiation factor 1A
MVKNTFGGNKSKGFARKHNNGGNKNNILRVSQAEGEIYAIVTKMCGNGMFECYCIDEVMRLGQIRGKFTGKGKRDNIVNNGTWVLIGVREWDIKKEEESMVRKTCLSKDEKLPKCDLLEVYNDKEKEQLQEEIAEKWSILIKRDPSRIEEQNDDDNGIVDGGFKFATDKDIERERLLKEAKMATSEKITLETTTASTESTDSTEAASTAADWVSIDEL